MTPAAVSRPAPARREDPADYILPPAALAAAEAARLLGQPLLIAGEPGSGKTRLAYHMAWRWGLDAPIRFDCKSSSVARDLLYRHDSLSHFNAVNTRREAAPPDPREFLRFEGLGRSIFESMTPEAARSLMGPWSDHPGAQRRRLVLIDEIDKAPADTPNDLLREIETMEFLAPELGRDSLVRGDEAFAPIVFITTNDEKPMPGPFLRRCCYHALSPPDKATLRRIVASRLGDLPGDGGVLEEALDLYEALRKGGLRRRPGTAEFLAYLRLLRSGMEREAAALTALAKGEQDQERAREIARVVHGRQTRA